MKTSLGRKAFIAFVITVAGGCETAAYGVTECTVTPTSVFSGDDGAMWVTFASGGSAHMTATDPDFKQTFALVTAAMLAGKSLVVRYAADGLPCTTSQEIVGMWLLQ